MTKYHRLLGDVALPDEHMLNRELVREGFCWWYRKYAPGDTVLEGLAKEAREGIDQADLKNSTMSLFPRTPKLGMVTRLLLTCFVLLLFLYSSFADFSGQVVSVLDGVLSKSSRKKGLVETPGAKACTQNLRYAFNREMNAAITHYDRDYLDKAFDHLERAHILDQSFTFASGC